MSNPAGSDAIVPSGLTVAVVLLISASWWGAGAQNITRSEQTQLYSKAKTYLADPWPSLQKQIPGLKGLTVATTQDELPDLLARVGAVVDDLSQRIPDLTAQEQVTMIPPCCDPAIRMTYQYIAVSRKTPAGIVFQEYRTDAQDKVIRPKAGVGPVAFGLIGSWLIFLPSNAQEAHFRYLGQERLGSHDSFVIIFAQIPGLVSNPVVTTVGDVTIPVLFQGIAWIDRADFHILKLRTDMLQARENIGLQKVSSSILLGRVDIAQLALKLWLPTAVDVDIQTFGRFYQERILGNSPEIVRKHYAK